MSAAVLLSLVPLAACSPSDPDQGTAVGTSAPAAPAALTAEDAGRAFLDDYVTEEGRVVRYDEGGDTVSEGQAYAMLVAAAMGEQETFRAVWSWTEDNLRRPDGLLSWRWADGAVADRSAASDADLDAARALVVAGEAFDDPRLTAEGVELGRVVLDLETVQTAAGRVLVAGDWATAAPYAYNPSYASPAATAVLAEASGDPRWAELDAGSRVVTASLLEDGALPPDWAQVAQDGTVQPTAGILGGVDEVRYGYDAARLPVRFAESCRPEDRALAAELAAPLRQAGDAARLDLAGQPIVDYDSVVAAIAQAAVATAVGDDDRARRELADAARIDEDTDTYYGAAWNALGRLMLTDDALGGCPPLEE
ncbi:glycosyl hydrolase family 8 [Blastococcus montanus]|uniref:glycosyl hydrolase family 8 n=1 Tax=Blastococcus montanus TaxID=3144973 RepID=UPI003209FDB4